MDNDPAEMLARAEIHLLEAEKSLDTLQQQAEINRSLGDWGTDIAEARTALARQWIMLSGQAHYQAKEAEPQRPVGRAAIPEWANYAHNGENNRMYEWADEERTMLRRVDDLASMVSVADVLLRYSNWTWFRSLR